MIKLQTPPFNSGDIILPINDGLYFILYKRDLRSSINYLHYLAIGVHNQDVRVYTISHHLNIAAYVFT